MPTAAILLLTVTVLFLTWERVRPGRSLPRSSGWYTRSIAINLVQLGVTLAVGMYWHQWWQGSSLLSLTVIEAPAAEGFIGWLVGTFVFYWWHRLRHENGFWQIFHQVHHSPSRIEVLTSFYKHPLEIFVNSLLTSVILFPLLGVGVAAAAWYNLFAATGEYFYHANVKTPRWLRYFIQTPELHSIHHQYDVHACNYSDIPVWDRLFDTYRDTLEFMPRCGFPTGSEERLGAMLVFRDVYQEPREA